MGRDIYSRFLVRLQKIALATKEDIDLDNFLEAQPKNIEILNDPFPHAIVDNFFKQDFYNVLLDQFQRIKKRGLSNDVRGDSTKFHAFNIEYDGYLYIPSPTLDPENPLRLFYSIEWNNFFSKLFKQFTSLETSFAFHHHPAGDKTGFVHHDFTDNRFFSQFPLPNGVLAKEGGKEADVLRRRVISLLIYLDNPEWKEGDGGETGMYSSDDKILLKTVPPINNRLFVFKTSLASMHAFQANNKERNCLVQWFYIPIE